MLLLLRYYCYVMLCYVIFGMLWYIPRISLKSRASLGNLWFCKGFNRRRQQEINSLRKEIANLKRESEKLEFDQDYIEKIAREKLKMAKPGEKVFKIEWFYLNTSLATLKDFKSGKWYLIKSEIKLEMVFLL